MKTFYDYLPPDKQIVLNTLETWRQALLAEGYAPATVNTNISAANGLLDYLGRRDLQLTGQLETETAPQSELTRTEYLRLLSAARALERRERIFGESNCPDRSPCRRTASDHCGGRAEWTHTSCLRR